MNNMGLSFLFFLSFGLLQVLGEEPSSALPVSFEVSTPFSVALDNLQTQINYTFKDVGFLRRAMTHASFSEENNKALSILGESVIETSVATRLLTNNVDISSKNLNLMIAKVSKVEGSCAADGNFLGLQKIVRVSSKQMQKLLQWFVVLFVQFLGLLLLMQGARIKLDGHIWRSMVMDLGKL